MKTIVLGLLFIMGVACSASGQASAQASASAVIVAPITIATAADMNFGNIAVSASPGTIALSPASMRSSTGGVTLPVTAGAPAAAAFSVTGESSYTYAITLPGALSIASGANTMIVDNFTSNPAGTGSLGTATPGTQTINVGARLNVGAVQPAGTYISPVPFDVTVNYN